MFPDVVAAQTAELLGHVLCPVLRAGLMAVHADAFDGTAMGADAVNDGLGVALPVQAGTLDTQLVALQTERVLTAMLGVAARADRHEAHYKPIALWSIRPDDSAVGCHLVRQVHDVIGLYHLLLIIYRCVVGIVELRYQTGLLLPFVHAGAGRHHHIANLHLLLRRDRHAEIAAPHRGEGHRLLAHAAQVLILGSQVAHLIIYYTIVADL